ncbi:trigger factor [Microbacterium sp. AISO3]|uniref:Trigger factor n=2 Tax=Microbacterium TaxID=33882 RepID=A0ABU1HY82_9MICO|nr:MULTISPECIES: trigger factor [Microbacterium]APF33323.1 trigger factor [Microbacterium paludicola]MDR6166351.1 trigger factor [Microbacterium paludicola]OAZ39661.1 trigger factor [Microbacterium arborescens]OWP22867.1 trigger factor [Microbacterium sp. AISO3]GAD32998.1 FKBP-type peptidyl-prolyl cis-trans isomerase [Microbacterium sp. TS-1]
MVTSTVETLSPTRVKLHITVSPDELKPSITHAYEHIAQDVQIPGFRKGKVPAPIIDQRVGRGAVIEHAVSEGLDGFYREAVTANELRVLGRPSAEVVDWPSDKDFSGDLKVEVEVDVRPEFELPAYEDITIEVEPVATDDAAIDEELDRLRGRFGTLVTVDRPAAKGDFVELDLVATIDGNEIDRAEGVSYEVGSGELLEGIDEAIESLTAGEDTTFRSKLVGGDHAGEEAEVAVTVKAVKERELPEADDDFAQMASEFDTIAELRDSLAERVSQQSVFTQGAAAREKLVDALLEKVEIPVPAGLVEDEVHAHLEGEGRLEDDVHRAEVTEASEKQFRTQMVLDKIAETHEVQVSQDELTQYLIQASAQYGMAPQDFVNALQQNGQLPVMVGEVARNKALAIALGKVTVVDTDGKSVDLTGFITVEGEESAADEVVEEAQEIADEAADADAAEAEEKPAKKAPAKKAPAKKKADAADAAPAGEEKAPAKKAPAKKAPAKKKAADEAAAE